MTILTRMTRTGRISACLLAFALLLLSAAACGGDGDDISFLLESELVTGAAQADAMEFAPDGRLFYIEHWTGNIRVVDANGSLLPEPFATVNVAADLQIGLTGLALDPDFDTNRFVYVFHTEPVDQGPPRVGRPVIVRFTDENNRGTARQLISDDFPEVSESPFNVNGRMHFGPDGYLYVTLGDYDMAEEDGPNGEPLAQDLGSPIGKILRLDRDGSPAPGNPFLDDPTADPRVFAYGFRAAFDFAFHPGTGAMYGSDSTGVTCEELNLIEAGKNYGWPDAGEWPFNDCGAAKKTAAVFHFSRPEMKPQDFDSAVALSGMEFVSGASYPSLGDSLLVCESRTQLVRAVTLGGAGQASQIAASEPVVGDCWLDITTGPDGRAYYSNLTEIRRILPETPE